MSKRDYKKGDVIQFGGLWFNISNVYDNRIEFSNQLEDYCISFEEANKLPYLKKGCLIAEPDIKSESLFDKTQQEFQEKFDELSDKVLLDIPSERIPTDKGSKVRYLEHQNDLFSKCIGISEKKNADYTGSSDDAFANFKNSETVGVSVEKGILVRLMDKISRINSFIDKGELLVKDESVDDTIMDAINYLSLLSGYIKEEKR